MDLLKKLYAISSPSSKEDKMKKFISKQANEYGATSTTIDKKGNLYITKGLAETYPCIIAHLDEVCPYKGDDFGVIEKKGVLFGYDFDSMEQKGIGGDDKNGIWIALKMMQELPALKVAFFVEEEIGCGGSSDADMSFFEDCRYVIQCDRQGGHDFVNEIYGTKLCSKAFIKDCKIKDFGYSKHSGMLTDAYVLKESGLNISCCNMSCGYYNPHTDNDATVIADLNRCLDFVRHICSLKKTYRHTYEAPSRNYFSDVDYYPYLSYGRYGHGLDRYRDGDREIIDDMSDWLIYNCPEEVLKMSNLHALYNQYIEGMSEKEKEIRTIDNFEVALSLVAEDWY